VKVFYNENLGYGEYFLKGIFVLWDLGYRES